MLIASKYNPRETEFLVDGFTNGFDIGYEGLKIRKDTSRNIPITVGSKEILWGKIMKEVKAGRYVGPFDTIPYENYIQSPIGLVPKAGGKTRLIFHLSHNFKNSGNLSLNACTPKEKCSVKYNDIDHVMANCFALTLSKHPLVFRKTDVQSAFRVLPLKISCLKWLIMKADNPLTKKMVYFVEKCLPFGASISCSHFQHFSDSLRHIFQWRLGQKNSLTNYLDDFLFVAKFLYLCNRYIQLFLDICEEIGVPMSDEKTEWASSQMTFLGMLLDGKKWLLSIPIEKVDRAVNQLMLLLNKKKATIKELQSLTGLLNFLTRAIFRGRAFTRQMYAKFSGDNLKHLRQYHHVKLDQEFRDDCEMWLNFLSSQTIAAVSQPFVDMSTIIDAVDINFSTDAAGGEILGYGCVMQSKWSFAQWEPNFVKDYEPSIEFLELFALCVGVFNWTHLMSNSRVLIHCDNQAVVAMINNTSSSCKYCMVLIRKLVMRCLQFNLHIFARYIRSEHNVLPDLLSRQKINKFKLEARRMGFRMDPEPTIPSPELWPLKSFWDTFMKHIV